MMMYMPNRMELLTEPPSLDDATESELTELERIEKFSQVEIPSYRQQACIDIDIALETCTTVDEYERIKRVAIDLISDQDLNVRVSMLDQLQHIAELCNSKPECKTVLTEFITNALLHALKDTNHQVRKSAQSSLLILMNIEFYTSEDLRVLFVETLYELLQPNANSSELNDFPPEAINLISSLSHHLGGDVITQKYLDVFIGYCSDMLLHIRKCCASAFPKFCQVVDTAVVQCKLLPVFAKLCHDDIWGVRKACAEGFVAISESVSQTSRVQVLTPLFLHLLNDTSRYVKLSAYQQLGPFITTFQNTSTGSDTTASCIGAEEERIERERSYTNPEYDDFLFWKPASQLHYDADELEKELYDGGTKEVEVESIELEIDNSPTCGHTKETATEPPEDTAQREAFNSLDDDGSDTMEIDEAGADLRSFLIEQTANTEDNKENENTFNETPKSKADDNDKSWNENDDISPYGEHIIEPKILSLDKTETEKSNKDSILVGSIDITKPVFGVNEPGRTEFSFTNTNSHELELASETSDMDIDTSFSTSNITSVPGALIDCYTNMACNIEEDNLRNDDDILTHCAYAFPGVVYTLGKDSWSMLRNTYLNLVQNLPHSMSSVRQTLACSLHEVATVIGPELTQQDLINPFKSFIYDIDKVKIGLLKNLAKFLMNVSEVHRQEMLDQMKEIQKCEDSKNWRYRMTFAEQLPHLSSLYTTTEVYEHFQPIIMNMGTDQVAEVRRATFVTLSKLLMRFKAESPEYYDTTCSEINEKFAVSNKCTYRQSFVIICYCLLKDSQGLIVQEKFLPKLIELVSDNTPNVRLWVGQCLLLYSRYDTDMKVVQVSLEQLQGDTDPDVRHFSTYEM